MTATPNKNQTTTQIPAQSANNRASQSSGSRPNSQKYAPPKSFNMAPAKPAPTAAPSTQTQQPQAPQESGKRTKAEIDILFNLGKSKNIRVMDIIRKNNLKSPYNLDERTYNEILESIQHFNANAA